MHYALYQVPRNSVGKRKYLSSVCTSCIHINNNSARPSQLANHGIKDTSLFPEVSLENNYSNAKFLAEE